MSLLSLDASNLHLAFSARYLMILISSDVGFLIDSINLSLILTKKTGEVLPSAIATEGKLLLVLVAVFHNKVVLHFIRLALPAAFFACNRHF